MRTLRQLLGALLGGAIVVGLVAGSVLLSAGDQRVAFVPSSTTATEDRSSPTSIPPPDTPTLPATATDTPTLVPTGVCPRPAGWVDHVVAPGEDLASIAAQYGLEAFQLQVFNCLVEPVVTAGQVLFVPPLPTPTPTLTVTLAAGVTPIATLCGPPPRWVIYVVRPGDTLSSLARATGTTVQAIMLANCLDTTTIRVGQRLYLPRQPFPTATRTPLPTFTFTPTGTSTATVTPSATPSPTLPTIEPPSATPTPSPSPSSTPTGTPTAEIATPTPSPTIDQPPTETDTPAPSATPSPSATL